MANLATVFRAVQEKSDGSLFALSECRSVAPELPLAGYRGRPEMRPGEA
jgi:hypothetical protein